MAGNKKPRKKYRPKVLPKNPLEIVATNNSPLWSHEKESILTSIHQAMYSLTRGQGTQEDWDIITGSLNMANALDELVFMKICEPAFGEAAKAHIACKNRYLTHGKFGYTGPELQHINDAISYHEEQLDKINLKEYTDALRRATERERTGAT